jgi:hypothetical protein
VTITEQAFDLAFPDVPGFKGQDPPSVQELAGITISEQLIDLVGTEGYIHGYICVRPPCGPKPGKVKPGDVRTSKDGLVVHKPSGWAIGSIEKNPGGKGYLAHHANGKASVHESKIGAEMEVTRQHNRSVTASAAPAKPAAPRKAATAPAKAVPKPAAAGKPEPRADSGTERSGSAVWNSDEGTASLSAAEKKSIANTWYGPNFYATNGYLRRDPSGTGLADDPRSIIDRYSAGVDGDAERQKYIADIGTFKAAIGKARPFTSDVKLLRGVSNPEKIFGPVGSSTGKSFTDKGFSSATSNMGVADSYSHGFGGKTALITIHAPKGSKALKVDPDVWKQAKTKKGQTPPDVLQEYTFAPGTSYKILADTLGADGVRRMDMEPQ